VHKSLSNTTDRRKTKSVPLPNSEEGILETSGLEGIAESRNSDGIPGLLNILQNIKNAERLRNWKIH
ncbi:uncharacterized protein METZ01_LOCUS111132, partial [marine metagenome]